MEDLQDLFVLGQVPVVLGSLQIDHLIVRRPSQSRGPVGNGAVAPEPWLLHHDAVKFEEHGLVLRASRHAVGPPSAGP